MQAGEKHVKSSLRQPFVALNETVGNDVIVDANCFRSRTDCEVIILCTKRRAG